MKFIYSVNKFVAEPTDLYIGGKPEPGSLMDKFNQFTDGVIQWENEALLTPFLATLKQLCIQLWDWFVLNLPDIMGYGTMLAGICIIIGAMFGNGGMLKALSGYAIALIIAFCILGGV